MPRRSGLLFFHTVAAPNKISFFCKIRIAMLCIVGAVFVILLEPHLFRFAFKRAVLLQAARHGTRLEIGRVEGSIFEPLVFKNVRFTLSNGGVTSKVSVDSAEMAFAWRALYQQKGRGFFDRLTLDRLRADVSVQPSTQQAPTTTPPQQQEAQLRPWLPIATNCEVLNSDLSVRLGNRTVSFAGVKFTVSSVKPGEIFIGKLTLEQGRLRRVFTALQGTTALQAPQLRVANLKLGPGILLKSLSSDLDDFVRGRLQVDFDFAAFGGSLRGELVNTSLGRQPTYEIAGNFSNISVEALAQFLQVGETTGGTIKEGKFNFRGSPHDLDNATISTRFEATDFRWGKRQWNSLVLGATVVNRRVQIPELELQQAHNTLRLKGELALPGEQVPWWLSDFSFDISARVANLTELSALFGPQFANTSGQLTADGSIRGDNKSYSGQILVAGSKLTWMGVPFDLFNAGIKLDGNELQIVNLEATHGTDYVRGKGVVNILGERRYQGELNASIEELATYGPLLQKPIVPAPPVGGLVVNWSGDGTTGVHSGAFTARFRKLHTLGTPEVPATLAIDADLEGTYAPGGLSLSKCVLANGDIRLECRLAADNKTLRLEGLKLTQKKTPWLEGEATLPFNLFQWWVAPSLAALAPDAPFKAELTAKGVQLEEVAHLTGRVIPIRGLLSGMVKTESTLRNLHVNGAVKLTKGQLPASEWVPALDNLEAEAEIDGNVLRFSKVAARHALGDFSATGSLDFSKFDAPAFDLLIHGEKVRFNAGPSWSGSANLALSIVGTRDAASVKGGAEITALETTPRPDFGALINTGNPETIRVPAPAIALQSPFDQWTYQIGITTPQPVKIKKGEVSADLRLSGTGSPLTATGDITITGLPAGTVFSTGTLESGTWYFGKEPTVVARLKGKFLTEGLMQDYEGVFFGSPEHLSSTFAGVRPGNDEVIQQAFTPGAKPATEQKTEIEIDKGPLVYDAKLAAELAAKQEAQPIPTPAVPPDTIPSL